MKVKALEVSAECGYITKGKVYDVQDPIVGAGGWVVDDVGDEICIGFNVLRECAHGVKWEVYL